MRLMPRGRPWLSKERYELLQAICLSSLFISNKANSLSSGTRLLYDLVHRSYAPIARYRFENFAFGFAPELKLVGSLLDSVTRFVH